MALPWTWRKPPTVCQLTLQSEKLAVNVPVPHGVRSHWQQLRPNWQECSILIHEDVLEVCRFEERTSAARFRLPRSLQRPISVVGAARERPTKTTISFHASRVGDNGGLQGLRTDAEACQRRVKGEERGRPWPWTNGRTSNVQRSSREFVFCAGCPE